MFKIGKTFFLYGLLLFSLDSYSEEKNFKKCKKVFQSTARMFTAKELRLVAKDFRFAAKEVRHSIKDLPMLLSKDLRFATKEIHEINKSVAKVLLNSMKYHFYPYLNFIGKNSDETKQSANKIKNKINPSAEQSGGNIEEATPDKKKEKKIMDSFEEAQNHSDAQTVKKANLKIAPDKKKEKRSMGFLETQYKKHNIQAPERHFVLGSGISPALDKLGEKLSHIWEEKFSLPFHAVPGVKTPTANTHQGLYRYFVHRETGKSVCFQCGRLHGYEDLTPQETVRPVIEPLLAGTKKFTLTNIGGGLKENLSIGTIIAIKDHVNFTGKTPLTGPNPTDHKGEPLGLRFPHMEEVYDKSARKKIADDLRVAGLVVEDGTYICVPGPNLETPTEVQLFAKWGLDVVGMSTVWEAIALKHAGAEVTGFSMISNPGSGLKGSTITDEDMLKLVEQHGEKMLQGFLCFCDREFKESNK